MASNIIFLFSYLYFCVVCLLPVVSLGKYNTEHLVQVQVANTADMYELKHKLPSLVIHFNSTLIVEQG